MPAGEGLPADRVEIMRQSILITAASSGIGKALSFELAHRGYSLALAVRRTIETNLIGAMATVDAAMAYFLQQGKGHIVGTCSGAAFPGAAPQCILQRLQGRFRRLPGSRRAEVFRKDIDVTVLYPGFIDTPLNQMLPKRPFARLLKILPTAVIGRM